MALILKETQLVNIFTPIDLSTADYNQLEILKKIMIIMKDCSTKFRETKGKKPKNYQSHMYLIGTSSKMIKVLLI